jgi:hypothetical protein
MKWRNRSKHLISALGWGEQSGSSFSRFDPRERAPGTHWVRGEMGPKPQSPSRSQPVPLLNLAAFWDVAPCSLVEADRRFSSASVYFKEITRRYIPEGFHRHTGRRVNLKPHSPFNDIGLSADVTIIYLNTKWTDTLRRQRTFALASASRQALKPAQPPINGYRGYLPGGKTRPGRAWRWPLTRI